MRESNIQVLWSLLKFIYNYLHESQRIILSKNWMDFLKLCDSGIPLKIHKIQNKQTPWIIIFTEKA